MIYHIDDLKIHFFLIQIVMLVPGRIVLVRSRMIYLEILSKKRSHVIVKTVVIVGLWKVMQK